MAAKPIRRLPGLCGRMLDSRKSMESVLAEAARDQDCGGAKLQLFDLLCIGIGGTIGSGVFVLTGKALPIAGPAATLSWFIACGVCLLSSFSYMELSARLPTKGSCYVFSYHGLGELASVVGAMCLSLEYSTSAAGVARTWSARVYSMMGSWWVGCYNGGPMNSDGCTEDDDFYVDPLAGLLTIVCHLILLQGVSTSKIVINVFTVAKLLLVVFMIVVGFTCWTGNMFESAGTFAPKGVAGVITASSMLFFGFIGFDEVCCMASKAVRPAKTMPRALVGTLIGAALVSATAQLSLASMLPGAMKGVTFEEAFAQSGRRVVSHIVHVGELLLLPLVCLLAYLPQPELMAAMSEDGLLPSLFCKVDSRGTYFRGTLTMGIVFTLVAVGVPFAVLWDMISIGVLVSFNLTNASLINIRYGNGGALRESHVDEVVWFLMACCAVSAGCLNVGVVGPLTHHTSISVTMLVVSVLSGLLAFVLVIVMRCTMKTQCDMDDPEIFKVGLVPFAPATAIYFNFYLLATFKLINYLYFAIFLSVFVGGYLAYICGKGSRQMPPNGEVLSSPHNVQSGSDSEADSVSAADAGVC